MNKAVIERLNSIPLQELFSRYHIEWEEGRNFRCPFPNHGASGKTPSGRFYPNTNSYGCFGCHKGGGPVNFIMNMENISFTEAANKLMSWYGIENIPSFSYKRYLDKLNNEQNKYNKEVKLQTLSSVLSSFEVTSDLLFRVSLLFCNMNLLPLTDFLKLAREVASKPLDEFLLEIDDDVKGLIKENLDLVKVLRPAQFSSFRGFDASVLYSGFLESSPIERWKEEEGRYIFPIFLPGKVAVGFGGRTLSSHITKYLTRFEFGFEKKDILYGLDIAIPAIIKEGYVNVVEGVLDVARCWSVGKFNTVAPMSTYLSEEQIILLKSFTKNFILAFDNDQGGNSATELSSKNLDKYHLLYERVLVPVDEDPDSFGKRDPQGLQNLLTSKWL